MIGPEKYSAGMSVTNLANKQAPNTQEEAFRYSLKVGKKDKIVLRSKRINDSKLRASKSNETKALNRNSLIFAHHSTLNNALTP